MVRPRVSEHNLSIALSFSRVLMFDITAENAKSSSLMNGEIASKGKRSVFATFTAYFPDLVRNSQERKPENRQGVSCIELNKAIKVCVDFFFECKSIETYDQSQS